MGWYNCSKQHLVNVLTIKSLHWTIVFNLKKKKNAKYLINELKINIIKFKVEKKSVKSIL